MPCFDDVVKLLCGHSFYLIKPVTDIAVLGQDFGQVAMYVGILAGIVVVMALAVMKVVRRLSTQALRLNG